MDEEQRLRLEVERAQQAAQVLEHPLFREAMDAYKQQIMTNWAESPARDTEGREKLWLMLKTAEGVERHLTELMQTGRLASIQLEQRQTRLERAAQAVKEWWQ